MRLFGLNDLLGSSCSQDSPTPLTSFRSEIDNMVGAFYDLHVMLDHDNGMALLDKLFEDPKQPLDIMEMKTGSRLIEDKKRACLFCFSHMGGELEPLRLAAGQSRQRLTQTHIIESHGAKHAEAVAYF